MILFFKNTYLKHVFLKTLYNQLQISPTKQELTIQQISDKTGQPFNDLYTAGDYLWEFNYIRMELNGNNPAGYALKTEGKKAYLDRRFVKEWWKRIFNFGGNISKVIVVTSLIVSICISIDQCTTQKDKLKTLENTLMQLRTNMPKKDSLSQGKAGKNIPLKDTLK